MSEDSFGFSQAKARLEEIVSQVRKKDTSLERSLDLLEEGVRLANRCTELIDQADWDAAGVGGAVEEVPESEDAAEEADDATKADPDEGRQGGEEASGEDGRSPGGVDGV